MRNMYRGNQRGCGCCWGYRNEGYGSAYNEGINDEPKHMGMMGYGLGFGMGYGRHVDRDRYMGSETLEEKLKAYKEDLEEEIKYLDKRISELHAEASNKDAASENDMQ
ncbi:MAG: DUF5320 domain-containing protein [Candidatus Micrarchaeia archaeon]